MKIARETVIAARTRSGPEGLALGFLRLAGITADFRVRVRMIAGAVIRLLDRSRGQRDLLVVLSGYQRKIWEAAGGWRPNWVPGGMSFDEVDVCNYCRGISQVIGVVDNGLTGHFAFRPHDKVLSAALPGFRRALELALGGASVLGNFGTFTPAVL